MCSTEKKELESIHSRYYPEIYRYCAYKLFSRDLAEDAASAVFVKLVEKYQALRSKGDQEIRSWLYGTASNVAASFLRDTRRQRGIVSELSKQEDNFSHNNRGEQQNQSDATLDWPVVYQSLNELKPKQREIVYLRFLSGMDIASIANVLGIKRGAVRVRLSRAIKGLGDKLRGNFE